MLEKIGLPERPSLRGNNWVVDASHCQGCSSQFTFINRKHHCRRCGGLFCGSCTQQRMVLRGQGDSPVRICDPCKKLEEAARFELRYGHKKKTGRGGLKLTSRHEDEALEQILGSDRKELVSAQSNASSSSSPILQEDKAYDQGEERSLETGSASPEELRQQALEEKKKYKFLKAEGKPEEALRAFKRGKELERQAGALELSLRKNRRKFVSSSNTAEIQKTHDETSFGRKNALDPHKSKDKEDLSSELKELGWSDLDLRNAEKKPATMSLEGELSTILGEVSQKTSTEKTSRVSDKSQVVSHKKRALALKREGKLAEAKEELKKAKILEKQQEEEEFLAEAEDSDDELSALIRSMDSDKQDNLSVNFETDLGFNFDRLINDDFDHNFEVTDEDMYDPEMDTALKSLGWTDESDQFEDIRPRLDREVVLVTIQSLKREAVNQKKVGNIVEAMELLRQAKLLEKDLDNYPPTASENPTNQNKDDVGIINVIAKMESKSAPKSRLMIQKELLSIKKTALALRREGKVDEANEELKKGTILEQQLEEMDNASKGKAKPVEVSHKRDENITLPDIGDEGEEDVTDHDMHDPGYLAVLKNLGWDDEDDKNVPVQRVDPSSTQAASSLPIVAPKKSKGEIQRELLGLKRKALSLRRQGEIEKAEEVQKMTKVLEAQLEEMEVPKKEEKPEIEKHVENEFFSSFRENFVQKDDGKGMLEHLSEQIAGVPVHLDKLKDDDLRSNNKITLRKREEVVLTNENPRVGESDSVHKTVHGDDQSSLRQEILILKRNAVALKKAGKLAEAKEELRKAKLLEKNSQGSNSDPGTSSSDASSTTPNVTSVGDNNNSSPNSVSKPLTSRDRFKLQQESLGHKRLSRKLRMEGRHEEADTEFELAKSIEAQLEESADKSSSSRSKSVDDVGVEDFLDPQLLSALNAIGIANTGTVSQSPEKTDPVKSTASKGENSAMGKTQLEEQIKEERLKAVTLKRSGNQAEALDALRRAKMLEKKLNFLSS